MSIPPFGRAPREHICGGPTAESTPSRPLCQRPYCRSSPAGTRRSCHSPSSVRICFLTMDIARGDGPWWVVVTYRSVIYCTCSASRMLFSCHSACPPQEGAKRRIFSAKCVSPARDASLRAQHDKNWHLCQLLNSQPARERGRSGTFNRLCSG